MSDPLLIIERKTKIMSQHGKTAGVARSIRDELNYRLENGCMGVCVVELLNSRPETKNEVNQWLGLLNYGQIVLNRAKSCYLSGGRGAAKNSKIQAPNSYEKRDVSNDE